MNKNGTCEKSGNGIVILLALFDRVRVVRTNWSGDRFFDAKERKLNKMTKSFPYRSCKLTMQFRILFHRQS